ncbi:restriction endonuclease subunit S [Flavobacterium sp. IB48]|uniref:restriction endonuclease subunit S n=1 Tax=Flavobacterium sp. IB48 TaxID=2779375 RepID=UPI0018E79C9F|nr:restriction endonuclease subunit S [Flavobacterium sp. IB48]MBJ2126306.1 restriction endonuclease subunit S [Flavobacterium sp. IB48]
MDITKYKNTSIGLIPSSWDIKPVGEAFRICNNLRLPISQDERNKIKGEYPYYGPTKIQGYIDNYRINGKYALIGEDGDHFLKWKDLQMTLLVEGKFNVNNHAHIIQGVDNLTEWFFYYFNHKELTPHLTRQGVGRYKLTKDSLSKIPCLLPPIKEQQKIVEILSTWDNAIDNCKAIIHNLKVRNKGLLNKLIIENEELKVKLGNIFIESKIPAINPNVNKRITVKLNLKGIEKRGVRGSEMDEATAYYLRKAGQFIYGKQNLHKGAFGIVPNELDGFESSSDIPAFDVNENFNINYIFYYFSRVHFFEKLESISTGTGSKRIQPRELYKIYIKIPSTIDKQNEIVKILDTATEELNQYQQKLQTLQLQKKGLMQQLLTGKIRVKNLN